jgi:hypothetical protein
MEFGLHFHPDLNFCLSPVQIEKVGSNNFEKG